MKPIQIFLGSGDPDDLDRLREQYRRASVEGENSARLPASGPQAVASFSKSPAADLKERVARLLGARAAAATRERRTSLRREVSKLHLAARVKARDAMRAAAV
jgi:hypothetical protein